MYDFNYFEPEYLIQEIHQQIINSVSENVITFISSSTGSGKSTQVPQYLFEYMQQKQPFTPFCIICTEPRSIACDSISEFISLKNPNIKIEKNDARHYFSWKGSNESKILFLKESDLLFILGKDPNLDYCDLLIIDEVHERTMKLELLLYFLKHFTLVNRNNNNINGNKNIKLVFMSATLNINDIYNYFSDILKKDSNGTFGIVRQNDLNNDLQDSSNYDIIYSTYYNPSLATNNKFQDYNMRKILREISKIIRYEIYTNFYIRKTILVFLPDYQSIYRLQNLLEREHKENINVYQFSSNLSRFEQKELLENLRNQFYNKSNIILATTLAETCLTFPNCDIVIDCGLKKNSKYNYDANIYEEVIEYISQDSCIQRSGRCGRERKRGICYRLFSEEMFNLLPKFRQSDVEIGNIDLIILKLFDCGLGVSFYFLNQIKKDNYLDFLTKVPNEKIDKIINKLINYKAIENYETTNFGKWIIKSNMDIELGYYFDSFKEKHCDLLLDETVFELMNIISTSDSYNCELFYTEVDPDSFKLKLLDYRKESQISKSATELSKLISSNIINKVIFGKEIKNDYLYGINYVSPYYKLFSMLDKIYNAKNFYTINKVFQLGDWMISLFFIKQYKLIKCLFHTSHKESDDENECKKCKISKYFYCKIYSLNEKYFQNLKNKIIHIKSILNFEEMSNNQLTTASEEYQIAKWNVIYLNLISNRPDKYLRENLIYKYLSEIEEINFDEIFTNLYNEYRKLYIDIAGKFLQLTKNDDEMIIQKKTFKAEEEIITLYFNKIEKINIMKNYFFEFLPKDVKNFFCFVKFRKIFVTNGGEKKLSQLYFKNINPIFDEMKANSYKITRHIESLDKYVETKEMKSYNNIGKYFYLHYIFPKLKIKNIERYHNSIVYVFDRTEKDYNKEQQIQDLIDVEKGNYNNIIDFIQCLKSGCITIQLSQGLNTRKIFDTYRQNNRNKTELIYEIKSTDTDPSKDVKYYYDQIINNSSLHYENIFIQKDQLIIVFKDTLNFSLFSEKQNLGVQLCPYKDNDITNININNININTNNTIMNGINNNINETINNENININNKSNMKIYCVYFDKKYPLEYINKTMSSYKQKMQDKYDCKVNYFIDKEKDQNSIIVYYYIVSINPLNISKKEIMGNEDKDALNNNQNFVIETLSFTSDYDYFRKFKKFCSDNHLNIAPCKNDNNNNNKNFIREYKLINYSTENMKLIQNYIGCIVIRLNSFAIMELKLKSKDTFLVDYQNIFQFARSMYCNVSFIYYENKIKIYGEPENRMKLFKIITDYFSELQKEKITFILKEQKEKLIIKSLLKKAARKQITILISEGESGVKQLEFRKKYYDYISGLFKKDKRLKNIKSKTITCAICLEKFDNKYNNNYFKLKLCGHKFCLECLKMQICNSLSSPNNIPIKCIKCQNIIANSDIFELFIPGTEEYNFVINKLLNLFMLKNSNTNIQKKYFWCPNKKENCNYIYNSTSLKEQGEVLLTCPNCNCKICLICNGLIEKGKQHSLECQSKLYSTLGEQNREWFIENSKDCPICHTVYEKNKGCNHMTCEMCKPPTHFCYICGKILDFKNPLSHFSEEGTKCYNRLWDDISVNERKDFYNSNNKTEIKDKNIEIKNNNISQNKNNRSMRENKNNKHNYDDLNCTMIMIDKVKNKRRENNHGNSSRDYNRDRSRIDSFSRNLNNSNIRNRGNMQRNRSYANINNSNFRRSNGFDY